MDSSVIWLPEALDDIDVIASFIARDSAVYASAFVKRVIAAAAALKDFPSRGRIVPEWNDESVREVYVGHYRLIHLIQRQRVIVLTVIHGARLLPQSIRDRMS